MNGKFVGGVDIVTELIENDEFDEIIPDQCKKQSPEVELKQCFDENKVVAII